MGFHNLGDIATSAYNFVSLPDRVLLSPLADYVADAGENEGKRLEGYSRYLEEKGRHSGYLELDMKLRTPLFIGGKGKKDSAVMDFISPMGEEIIPGSTIRGMVKNLYKILTLGAMRPDEDFTERRLYYRCLMAVGPGKTANKALCAQYKERIGNGMGGGDKNKTAKPGFLARQKTATGLRYFIYPVPEEKNHSMLMYDFEREHEELGFAEADVLWYGEGHRRTVFCSTGKEKKTQLLDKAGVEEFMRVTPPNKRMTLGKQYIHYFRTDEVDWNHPLEVADDVILNYREDKNRKCLVNLLGEGKSRGRHVLMDREAEEASGIPGVDRLVPCYFIQQGGRVIDFGHGSSYRIGYRNTIGDVIRRQQGNRDYEADFTDAVFGDKERWASRIFFDDGIAAGPMTRGAQDDIQPLMGPNPTSFQLYLEQPDPDREKLMNWDSNGARIRGYKLYWHKDIKENGWVISDTFRRENDRRADNNKLSKKIRPLAKGNSFTARIRFRELTDEELGALLYVFNLNKDNRDISYKMGMGKSMGMGSVDIKATLFEEESAYDRLFEEDGWNKGYRKGDKETLKKYMDAYEAYVESCGQTEEWMHIVGELSMMLDWGNTKLENWNRRTAILPPPMGDRNSGGDGWTKKEVDKFATRAPLATVREVVENKEVPDR